MLLPPQPVVCSLRKQPILSKKKRREASVPCKGVSKDAGANAMICKSKTMLTRNRITCAFPDSAS